MYAEQPEYEITCDGNNPIEREVYQILLNAWGNTKAFFDYWDYYHNWREAARQEPVRSEVPLQTDYEASLEAAWPRKRVHKRVLQPARDQARVRQG